PAHCAPEKHRMTPAQLQALSRKELAEIARKRGIEGWHGMRKEELVDAIIALRAAAARDRSNKQGHSSKGSKPSARVKPSVSTSKPVAKNGTIASKSHSNNGTALKSPIPRATSRDTAAAIDAPDDADAPTKDLSEKASPSLPTGYTKDRIVTMVRD